MHVSILRGLLAVTHLKTSRYFFFVFDSIAANRLATVIQMEVAQIVRVYADNIAQRDSERGKLIMIIIICPEP